MTRQLRWLNKSAIFRAVSNHRKFTANEKRGMVSKSVQGFLVRGFLKVSPQNNMFPYTVVIHIAEILMRLPKPERI